MKTLTYKDILHNKGYLSWKFRDEILEKYKDRQDAVFLNPAYTDYGGDIQDRVFCEAVKRKFIKGDWEPTGWNGCNAIIPVTNKELSALEEYPFPVIQGVDTEDLLSEIEDKIVQEAVDFFLEDYPEFKNKTDLIYDFLRGCNIYPTMVDYCEDNLIEFLKGN